jgi:hypothetical protein
MVDDDNLFNLPDLPGNWKQCCRVEDILWTLCLRKLSVYNYLPSWSLFCTTFTYFLLIFIVDLL